MSFSTELLHQDQLVHFWGFVYATANHVFSRLHLLIIEVKLGKGIQEDLIWAWSIF